MMLTRKAVLNNAGVECRSCLELALSCRAGAGILARIVVTIGGVFHADAPIPPSDTQQEGQTDATMPAPWPGLPAVSSAEPTKANCIARPNICLEDELPRTGRARAAPLNNSRMIARFMASNHRAGGGGGAATIKPFAYCCGVIIA
ncbi:jg22816 [Pararge aegeria aegeria]|uniref:Jg22816 protein n=1 Tax=Pararge aegeria aegeria TaxID=348720 RepID=A0A8S4RYC1_9NEOP|nr:jg22816 [Pararge aegeria aegeria]